MADRVGFSRGLKNHPPFCLIFREHSLRIWIERFPDTSGNSFRISETAGMITAYLKENCRKTF